MFRFAIKAGLAGGAVYYLNQEGIWKESDESLKAYEKLNTALSPYIDQAKKQLPFETPQFPNSERSSHIIKESWNRGVIATFHFLICLPSRVSGWTRDGVNAILENPDVQKLFETTPSEKSSKK